MDTPACDALAQFCADQRYAFDAREWRTRARGDRHAIAVAARYLSMTSWYGHEEELKEIAEASTERFDASAGGASAGLQHESQAAGIDLAQFSVAVRSGIALRRLRLDRKPRRQELVD